LKLRGREENNFNAKDQRDKGSKIINSLSFFDPLILCPFALKLFSLQTICRQFSYTKKL
jgi:hypothetical protein